MNKDVFGSCYRMLLLLKQAEEISKSAEEKAQRIVDAVDDSLKEQFELDASTGIKKIHRDLDRLKVATFIFVESHRGKYEDEVNQAIALANCSELRMERADG